MAWFPYMEHSGTAVRVFYHSVDENQPWIIHRGGKRWLVTAWHGDGDSFVIDDAEELP